MLFMFLCEYCGKEFKNYNGLCVHKGLKHKKDYEENRLNSYVVIGKDTLNITNKELLVLKNKHSGVCDICGKHETANTRPQYKSTPNNLCIDHNHNTKKFRGFLCVQCNRNMGWLDRYYNEIMSYNK